MPGIRSWLTLLILATIPSQANAWMHFLGNATILSPDGKWRLEIRVPPFEEPLKSIVPMTSLHETPYRPTHYAMVDTSTGKQRWSRLESKFEGDAVYASVDNLGHSILLTREQIIVINSTGQFSRKITLGKHALPPTDVTIRFPNAEDSWKWERLGYAYRFDIDGRSQFCLRMPRDRRVIVDVEAAKLVPDKGAVSEAATKSESEFVRETIRKAGDLANETSKPNLAEYSNSLNRSASWRQIKDLDVALHLAARLQLRDVIPTLLQMEKIPCFDINLLTDFEDTEGQVRENLRTDRVRQQVQLTLRRLGTPPAGYPVRALGLTRKFEIEFKPYVAPRHGITRAQRVDQVARRMSAKELVDVLGEPDYITHPSFFSADRAWEYDIDDEESYTLRVFWRKGQVHQMNRISPPLWKVGDQRNWQD